MLRYDNMNMYEAYNYIHLITAECKKINYMANAEKRFDELVDVETR